ncbi:MAG: alanine racemase [Sphingobacteriales bacterium JAD_PAG50586_3]|nr:MAG: alanine racemase [Sphingobacteriales bacterium JAD_PAG50586_3]
MVISNSQPLRQNTLEVNLGAAAKNIQAVRNLVGPNRKIFAVVKANGYGYGAAEMGSVFVKHGADALAVGNLSEGIRLRKHGINVPILVYPNSLPEAAKETIVYGLLPVLVDLESAQAYSNAAKSPYDVFVNIDVGYERLGIPAEMAPDFIAELLKLPNIRLGGICAHGHAERADQAYVEWQLNRFVSVVDKVEKSGVKVPIRLLAASPFIMNFPETYLNAVDPGRMLYGINYTDEETSISLKPVLKSLKTYVIAIKDVIPRKQFAELVPFPITRPMKLGMIPIGIADGLTWLKGGEYLFVHIVYQ